jgi:hypothetical protein
MPDHHRSMVSTSARGWVTLGTWPAPGSTASSAVRDRPRHEVRRLHGHDVVELAVHHQGGHGHRAVVRSQRRSDVRLAHLCGGSRLGAQEYLLTPAAEMVTVGLRHARGHERAHVAGEVGHHRRTLCRVDDAVGERHAVDHDQPFEPRRVAQHGGHGSERAQGLAGQHASLDLVVVEHREQVIDQCGGADRVRRERRGSGTTVVVGDAPPARLHQLERFLPQLPRAHPTTVGHERGGPTPKSTACRRWPPAGMKLMVGPTSAPPGAVQPSRQ